LFAVIKTKSSLTSNAAMLSGAGLAGAARIRQVFRYNRETGRPGVEEIAVVRRLVRALGLIVVLAPATALAQVNIDQDKSPAQLYAGDCAACHKSVRGLANGRSASALAGFLIEHYTASSREASAIAAYVLASGGAAAPARAQPERERTRANADEPRSRDARRPAQPEARPPGNAAARKPEPERRAAVEPGQPGSAHGPALERHERGTTRGRGRAKPAEAVNPPPVSPPPAPAAAAAPEAKTAVAAPPAAEAAAPAAPGIPAGTEPKAAAPAQSGETAPGPRDNIPD
jgi:hypothetical protein